jgi:DNA-binding LacI/PurR family transcriptional regulator
MPLDPKNPAPLYLQIVEDIKSKISTGRHKVGDQLGSQHELSREYGVSLITVKKALTTLVHEGIIYSRVGKGTYVARKNRTSPSARGRTIGLVLRDLQSPFFSLIVQGVEAKAYEYGLNVMLSNSSGRAEKEDAQIEYFRKMGVGGLIIASMSHIYHPTSRIRALLREKFPFVMVSYIEDEDVPFVGTDHELGGYLATQHLLSLGFRTIGYINGEEGNLVGELRKRGYVRALHEHGIKINQRFLFRLRLKGEWNDFQSGYEIGEKVLRSKVRPDAMFVYNDLSALGFQQALLEGGITVPQDMGIVGFDNIERGEYAPVPLTTVEQPTMQIGMRAVEVLKCQMEGKEYTTRSILQPRLLIRKSCGGTPTKVARSQLETVRL